MRPVPYTVSFTDKKIEMRPEPDILISFNTCIIEVSWLYGIADTFKSLP